MQRPGCSGKTSYPKLNSIIIEGKLRRKNNECMNLGTGNGHLFLPCQSVNGRLENRIKGIRNKKKLICFHTNIIQWNLIDEQRVWNSGAGQAHDRKQKEKEQQNCDAR